MGRTRFWMSDAAAVKLQALARKAGVPALHESSANYQRVLKRKHRLLDEREKLLGDLPGWEWEPLSGKASPHWRPSAGH